MSTFTKLMILGSVALLPFAVMACNDDEDSTDDATGGTGNSATGGDGGSGDTAATGGGGGAPPAGEEIDLSGEITADQTLTAENTYTLVGSVYVKDGVTLTIEPGTVIKGDKESLGTLIVERGGKIEAVGTAAAPIRFTAGTSNPQPGDWGGLVLLGKAPNSLGTDVNIEGTAQDDRHQFGGTAAADSSGSLAYVIIEYPGIDLGEGKEINGLSLGSVGSGTTISHVAILNPLDDCFEWFGGTVDADHLICENPGDDMFDTDDGYQGTLSFLFGRHGTPSSEDPNGFEWDGTTDKAGTIQTEVTATNITLCNNETADYSIKLRRGITGSIDKAVTVGFSTGFDYATDEGGALTDTTITNSSITAPSLNGALGADAWFTDGEGNTQDDAGFTAEECMASGGPAAAVTGSDTGAFEGDATWIDFAY